MDIRELRIGNLILREGKIITVTDLTSELEGEMVVVSGINKQLECVFNPIPLTEDILLKCGFNKIAGYFCHPNCGKFELLYKGDCYNAESISIVLNQLYYLHQLQNLYFALTNEELNIEL